ncbi:hypothetical protein [uncultured Clostridium sp.]|uniref:hypothetical protein n=1 Tax=uncultured Clostridium sp. TaxID=59620 RepID=UPI0026331373|nr:hypothetical protein [uncultured Clostridium sp.]
MKFVMIASSIFALIVLNVVMLTFVRHSANLLISKILMLTGSFVYVIASIFSYKITYIVGQNAILIGIVFGVYGLYKHRISNLPVIIFSITFISTEFLAHLFNIKILMFSTKLSGSTISTILSILLPLSLAIITHLFIHKKAEHI